MWSDNDLPRNGVKIESVGNLILPKHAAMVVIDVNIISGYIPKLRVAHQQVGEFQRLLALPKHKLIYNLLSSKLLMIEDEITKLIFDHHSSFGGNQEIHRSHGRSKRWALFPIVGSAMKTLFGTATTSQIHLFEGHLQNLNTMVQNNSLIIEHNLRSIEKQTKVINSIMDDIHSLVQTWRNSESQINEIRSTLRLVSAVQRVYDSATFLATGFKEILRAIAHVADGRVTSDLLPPSELATIINGIHAKHNLKPLIKISNVHHYYPLLKGHLLNNKVLVYIPFIDEGPYSIHKLHAFPITHENNVVMPRIVEDQVIILSPNKRLAAFARLNEINSCDSPTYKLFVCNPNSFLFFDTSIPNPDPMLECSLSQLFKTSFRNCHFHSVNLMTPYWLVGCLYFFQQRMKTQRLLAQMGKRK